jgi:hypothetical protein
MRAWGILFSVTAATALLGCSKPHQIVDRADYVAEGTRTYTSVSREQVITAAETILKVSDPTDWDFRYDQGGFTGLRRYTVYAVLAAASGREKWQFETEVSGRNAIRASITISDAGVASGGYTVTPYEGKMANVELYRLFWMRLDYMLGKRPDWVTCEQARETLEESRLQSPLSGLCGTTSQGRDAIPAPMVTASTS